MTQWIDLASKYEEMGILLIRKNRNKVKLEMQNSLKYEQFQINVVSKYRWKNVHF